MNRKNSTGDGAEKNGPPTGVDIVIHEDGSVSTSPSQKLSDTINPLEREILVGEVQTGRGETASPVPKKTPSGRFTVEEDLKGLKEKFGGDWLDKPRIYKNPDGTVKEVGFVRLMRENEEPLKFIRILGEHRIYGFTLSPFGDLTQLEFNRAGLLQIGINYPTLIEKLREEGLAPQKSERRR
jgi:hypothetical protein